jgi:hypothetical protein
MIKMTDLEKLDIESIKELIKIAKIKLQEKISLENELIMTGWAVKTNKILEKIDNTLERTKLEKECEEIWTKWYIKVQKEVFSEKNLKIFEKLKGKMKYN